MVSMPFCREAAAVLAGELDQQTALADAAIAWPFRGGCVGIGRRLLHQWIAPKYLCSCQYIADGFLASLPYLRKEDIRVVLTAKQTCTTAIQAHSPRRLVVTQQLMADKDHATLLRALAPIQTPYELHVAGTGETEASLKALAQQHPDLFDGVPQERPDRPRLHLSAPPRRGL